MNSINKIGVMALTKIFAKKPFVSNEVTYISELIFCKEEITSDVLSQKYDNSESYQIWSIELGLIEVQRKENQSIYQAALRVLKKLQKDSVPSHLIITNRIELEDKFVKIHRIYRLTEEQENTMYFQDLLPSITKREEALRMKAEKEHVEYLTWCESTEKEHAKYLEWCKQFEQSMEV